MDGKTTRNKTVFGWAPDPKRGVLDWKIFLIFIGAACFVRATVSLWHHEFKLAVPLLCVVLIVIIILRSVGLFILGSLMFLAVNGAIAALIEGKIYAAVMALLALLASCFIIRRELKQNRDS